MPQMLAMLTMDGFAALVATIALQAAHGARCTRVAIKIDYVTDAEP